MRGPMARSQPNDPRDVTDLQQPPLAFGVEPDWIHEGEFTAIVGIVSEDDHIPVHLRQFPDRSDAEEHEEAVVDLLQGFDLVDSIIGLRLLPALLRRLLSRECWGFKFQCFRDHDVYCEIVIKIDAAVVPALVGSCRAEMRGEQKQNAELLLRNTVMVNGNGKAQEPRSVYKIRSLPFTVVYCGCETLKTL